MRIPPMTDRVLRGEIRRTDMWLRQLAAQQSRTVTLPQGTPSANTSLGQQLLDYLYLPGRTPYQQSRGVVIFETGGNADVDYSQGFPALRGLVLEAKTVSGSPSVSYAERIHFQVESSGANSYAQWIFPNVGSSPKQATFVATSAAQTLTNKIIQDGVIHVGSNSAANIFRSTDSGNKEFIWVPNTGFPTTSTQTPTINLPNLDQTEPLTNVHTLMMLASNAGAPFVTGSIAHGNVNGSEMEMLAAGTNGGHLQYNGGEAVTGTWTAGATTIFGNFNATGLTKVGMRVRGGTSSSVCVPRDTKITAVSDNISIDVDTALVGNNAGGLSVTTYGPTWSTSLSAMDHGTLAGLSDDDHPIYLYLQGRAGGQVLGTNSHTSGGIQDFAVEGRMMIGDGHLTNAWTTGRALDIKHNLANDGAMVFVQPVANSPSSAATGTLSLFHVQTNAVAYSSGSYAYNAFRFLGSSEVAPDAVTVSAFTTLNVQATPSEGSSDPGSGGTFGGIQILRGGNFDVRGASTVAQRSIVIGTTNTSTAITSAGLFVAPITAGMAIVGTGIPARTLISSITDASNAVISNAATATGGPTVTITKVATEFAGFRMTIASRSKPYTQAAGLIFESASGGIGAYVASFAAIDIDTSVPFNSANVETWSLIQMSTTLTTPGATWMLNLTNTNNSRHVGNFSIGTSSTPTAKLFLGAGTATASTAPLKFTSGTSLTAAEAGAVEFTTDDLFFTITTGAARKAFILDDGTRLTAGRVPFATTNGRLTDDADMTFATDTLTVTKIAATQFTGDVQFTGTGVGWPYGSCYGNEIAWTQAAAAAGTFYEVVDTDMTDGELNNVAHDGSGKLTVSIAGRYLINYSVSLEADAANIHLLSAISVNGTEIAPGRMHFHRHSASAANPLAGTAIVNLAASDTVEIAVATADAGAPQLGVDHLNLSIVQVGG